MFASRTTGVLRCAKKWDTTVVLIASSFLALFIGAIFQPIAWMDMVQSAVNGFKDTMLLQFDGIASDPLVAKNLMVLLNRGGIYSMVSPIVVMLCAFYLHQHLRHLAD